ncbi:MAG: low temperature requirement protein A [Anaerolineae bacterium]|nr:low temperature requirement protein A [Anaerolineae bacterium]
MSDIETRSRPRWIRPMEPRSPDEVHRQATPLELFFDLVFVVAIAQAASALHHGVAEGHAVESLVSYGIVFFAVWWAWMNFTWFASGYDNGDVPYRIFVFIQMTGALIMASGVEPLFLHHDFSVTVFGYVVMRVANVTQYLRAAYADPVHRPATLRYAIGIGLAQVGWVLMLFLPPQWQLRYFILGVIIELLVPIWAKRASPTAWHADHIRERYGLFNIIVLGETILSTSMAIQTVSNEGILNASLITTIAGSLLIAYSMWWLYFYQPADHLVESLHDALIWGYGHFFIYSATAAVGAGLAVVIDQITHHAEISTVGAGLAVALPVSVYVFSLWILHEHPNAEHFIDRLLHPIIMVLILLTPFTGQAVLLTGILLVFLVAVRLVRHLE